MLLFLFSVGLAAPQSDLKGDLKSFTLATFPYENMDVLGGPSEDTLQAAVAARLKATFENRDAGWRLEMHLEGSYQGVNQGTRTGIGLQAPQLVDLTLRETSSQTIAQLRVDRLIASYKAEGVHLTVGRQPVSFGTGLVFAPMDLVNPFSATTIDTEYKPGVDALRADLYSGGTQVTAVGAWAGSPVGGANTDVIAALHTRSTVGVSDVLTFGGLVRGEAVFGIGLQSSVGVVGVHGDATVTLPSGEDAFVRAVVGADYRPTSTTTFSGEAYLQTYDASWFADERLGTGELWTRGRTYAAVMVSQELSPLWMLSAVVVANVEDPDYDPSAMVSGSLTGSLGDNTSVSLGTYLGVGERPDIEALQQAFSQQAVAQQPATAGAFVLPDDPLRSEFGVVPVIGFLSFKQYF